MIWRRAKEGDNVVDLFRDREPSTAVLRSKAGYWDLVALEWGHAQPDLLWRKHSDQVNLALLAKWLPDRPVQRLLKTDLFDEATGEGLIPFLLTRANKVIGIDVSPKTLRMARVSRGISTCADVRLLPFADNSFDVVVSNSTLDHFLSLDEVKISLRELRRVLRPGGQLLLTLDNLANPVVALRNLLPFNWLHRMGVVPYYVGATCGPRRLRRMLEDVGLNVAETTATLHCPRVMAVQIARAVQAQSTTSTHQKLLRWLMIWERLSTWPTRFLTGNFIAVRCVNKK